ncbi:polysaccharide deacetylase family protein [Actinocrinis puniceicyclus]|uniref:Polysaccharide deacetylase family protein n=1 Tax=Actinocrinis puniceicyclus TaxID=977794 RepID=A0A8J7WPW9_9ACTN|nr:polysaccharide deacetylase family protein [Actinocrinis puniceicyclus]MBS2963349.1 polysaccharide deacetylase family protein [Actinocrinis puniceicyclus]
MADLRLPRALRAAGLLALTAHVLPAGTWLPPVRRTLFPALAGLGAPGHVALTFDDGPDPASTPFFLDELDRLGVRATFFLLGEHAARHVRLTRELAERGHELGVHGWTHDYPWLACDPRQGAGIRRTQETIELATGSPAGWYRPAYGILTGERWAAAARCGLRTVLWSAWGRDWTAQATARSVYRTLRPGLRGGATLLLHDSDRTGAAGSWRAALAALPLVVGACRAAGLAVGPLGAHGIRGSVGGAAEGHPES